MIKNLSRDGLRRFSNLIFALTQAAIPALGYAGLLGKTTGSQIQTIKTGVVPANYTFAIWSVIFLFSILYAGDQSRPSKARDPLYRHIGWFTALAFAANTVWSVVAQLEYPLVVTGLIFLFCVVPILAAAIILAKHHPIPGSHWISQTAVGLLAGWVSIAIFANWSVILADAGFASGPGEVGVALTFLSAAGVLASFMIWKMRSHLPYLLAVSWALIGLIVGNSERGNTIVSLGSGLWLAAILILAWKVREGKPNPESKTKSAG